MKTTYEDPLLDRYAKTQREVIPHLTEIVKGTDVRSLLPKALDPVKFGGGILYYEMLHMKTSTLCQPDAILIVYPEVSVVGMDCCGLFVEEPDPRRPEFYRYYAMRNGDDGKKKVVKWLKEKSKFVTKQLQVECTRGKECETLIRLVGEFT